MATIYEITMFLAIALLAIVVTVFVLATSLLGRAIEEAGKEQREIKERQAKEREDDTQRLRVKVEEATASGKLDMLSNLKGELDKSVNLGKKFQKELKHAEGRYHPLTARGSVLYPGVVFLSALVFAGAARYVTTTQMAWVAHILWGLSLPMLAYGCYRVYQSLRIIEKLAVTTEEAQHRKAVADFVVAMEQYDTRTHPIAVLEFTEKTPFVLACNAEKDFHFKVFLKQGDFAENLEVWFSTVDGFTFPGAETAPNPQDDKMLFSVVRSLLPLKKGLMSWSEMKVKAPAKPGAYTLTYELVCKGFDSGPVGFVVEVK